ncbi:hypothetical protein SODG_003663 [Sodalis praecaptivus]|uniref:hypothetical protein n=1 Tax=Sodalis praecaptivus TaxID=1239307 RepID=UPI0027F797FA|nr:hypothetical protein [Sodalis praecaptivus]CAJ0992164.1 hypothetical protein NVIRENTERO_00541 [Sodalis praecaptivus]
MDITAIGAFSVNSRHGSGGTSQHPAQRRNVGPTAAPRPRVAASGRKLMMLISSYARRTAALNPALSAVIVVPTEE